MGMVATTDCDLQGVFQTFAGPEATAFYKNWVSKKSVLGRARLQPCRQTLLNCGL